MIFSTVIVSFKNILPQIILDTGSNRQKIAAVEALKYLIPICNSSTAKSEAK